jgi:hypothetical protein
VLVAHLSIRQLPELINQALQREAAKKRTTKTEIVLNALNDFFNLTGKNKKKRRNVRTFFGKMTKKEYQEFQKNTSNLSDIDEDMWK